MSNYASVQPTFWTGETGRKLREAGPEAQLVALYLLSNSHRNALGLYYLPKLLISHETALTEQGASKGLLWGIQTDFCAWDGVSEVVWVKKMAIYQIGEELKQSDKRVKWVNDLYNSLPNNLFLYDFWQEYGTKYHIIKPRGIEGASKALASPSEANISISISNSINKRSCPSPKNYPPDFETFWTSYPRKIGKAKAFKAWKTCNGNRPDIQILVNKIEQFKKSDQWKEKKGKFIPYPASWISAGRWDDQLQVDIGKSAKPPTFFQELPDDIPSHS